MRRRSILVLDRHTPRSKATLGGGQMYLLQLAAVLRQRGFEVDLCTNPEPSVEAFLGRLRDLGVTIHQVRSDPGRLDRMAAEYDAIAEELEPAIIHLHNHSHCMRTIALEMRAFRNPSYKRTLTMHLPLTSVSYAKSSGISVKDRLPFSWYSKTKRTDQRFVDLFDRIICVSRVHGEALGKLFRQRPGKIVTIPNGVDVSEFSADRTGDSNHSAVVIGGAGLLEKYKRFDLLVEAAKNLGLGQQIQVRIAGEGSEEASLKAAIENAGLLDVIRLVGHQKIMRDFLRSLDVFVMPSDNEGCPYALLEAMAVGLPAVVTNAGDMPVIVRDGIDGFVVERNDSRALTECIRRLASEPKLRESMGRNARQRACDEFSVATSMERTADVFIGLIKVGTETSI
jgi:glycosyltransferase involved in cell wall biosynthesis